MTYENILYEKQDRIARITLNRPEKLNALSKALLVEYSTALTDAERDEEVRVVIVKGAGRAFSAGYDVEPGAAGAYSDIQPLNDLFRMQDNTRMITTAWNLHKPVIAQVHGYCVAGGNDVAAQCDIIIAAENAVFMHPQIRRLGLIWMHMTTYNIGAQRAKMLMFTGDQVNGKEAEQIGLVAKAVPEDKLEEAVTKLAQRIAQVPSELLALNKAAVNRVLELMGVKNFLNSGMELDVICHNTQAVQDFRKLAEEKGLEAALKENDAPFKTLPKPFE